MDSQVNFENYMKRVDEWLDMIAGVCHLDLPDYDYAGAWESDKTSQQAARAALKAAGF